MLGIGDDHDPVRSEPIAIERAVFPRPPFEHFVEPREIELEQVADDRPAARTGEIVDRAFRCDTVRRRRALRDVDEHVAVLLGHRVARETLRPILPAAIVDVESPAMIAADERAAIDLAFAKERTLVRTTSLKGSQPLRAPHDHEIHAVGSHGMRSSSRERIRSRDAHSHDGGGARRADDGHRRDCYCPASRQTRLARPTDIMDP